MMDLSLLCNNIKTEAVRLGFKHVGIAQASSVPHFQAYLDWIESGYHAEMNYLSREDAIDKRANPVLLLKDCQRVICLAYPYNPPKTPLHNIPLGKGRISAYSTMPDYHQILWKKLAELETFIRYQAGVGVGLRSYTDTGPILERSFASSAGLGIAGKNSCLIIPRAGSYFFLAEILTDLPLPIDQPFTTDLCKNCQRCIESCPTDCILPNRTIDANRCISYLTIENKDIIPDDLKPKIGDWVFGCDVCQMVCPHNHPLGDNNAPVETSFLPESLDLVSLFTLSEDELNTRYSNTALSRAKRSGLLRNAAIVLGNQRFREALGMLENAIDIETDPIILDACRWAVERIKA